MDSGGGLIVGNTIVGILSAGNACDDTKIPAVYTRVSSYIDFIEHALKDEVTSDMNVFEPYESVITKFFNKIFRNFFFWQNYFNCW